MKSMALLLCDNSWIAEVSFSLLPVPPTMVTGMRDRLIACTIWYFPVFEATAVVPITGTHVAGWPAK